jgi:glutamine---fructose-6-phosphate transaminase (isomerizing)
MCGIVGYVGSGTRQVLPILVGGLKRLEYRGYDSAGVAVRQTHGLKTYRAKGSIQHLEERLRELTGEVHPIGIGHTRWATHGPPSETNAHPHLDCTERFAVVHNGIIENAKELRKDLEGLGHVFRSETDTEILAHLLEEVSKEDATKSLAVILRDALAHIEGTYGVAVMGHDHPGQIAAARLGSPLLIGISDEGRYLASSGHALLAHTDQVVHLRDRELAILRHDYHDILSSDLQSVPRSVRRLEGSDEEVRRDGYPHFMLKEIFEQPRVIEDTMRGRLNLKDGTAVLGGLHEVVKELKRVKRLVFVACGSAHKAALVGEQWIEQIAKIPVEVEIASEFRYRSPILTPGETAVIAISQSGETADTLQALREAKAQGVLTFGIVNAVGTVIAQEAGRGIYNHAGPEIGVASTKAFVSQLVVLALVTLYLARERGLSLHEGQRIVGELEGLPEQVRRILETHEAIRAVAVRYRDAKNFFYLGRLANSSIAAEGALKLKEVSYIHAEAYAAGEMKHGPIALIEPDFPSLVICPKDSMYQKTRSNIAEIQARGGRVIVLTNEGNRDFDDQLDVIKVPDCSSFLFPILAVIPLQLFAYEVAVARGLDPDKPRNLAKSVTVE